MKHLVASSIAVPSVPCFHPNLSFLFSMSQGLYTRKTWSTERPVYQLLHSSTTAWSSQMWFLRLVYNRNACDSREAEFNRKPVKITIQTLRSSAPHPFLTSLLLKLASGVFLTRHGFCFDGQKRNSIGLSSAFYKQQEQLRNLRN